jgi:AcrR family transcriptional regulator
MLERSGQHDTKGRILDAAERLFADEAIARTSLRAITIAAGVNVAAVHYHFGSKEALLESLWARRVEPINRERLARLDALEADAAGAPVAVEAILEAFLVPPFRLAAEMGQADAQLATKLIGRFYSEPEDLMERVLREQFGEAARRFHAAFCRALPHLPPDAVAWRLQSTVAALTHVLSGRHRFEVIPGVRLGTRPETALRQLIPFCAAGFRAAAAEGA